MTPRDYKFDKFFGRPHIFKLTDCTAIREAEGSLSLLWDITRCTRDIRRGMRLFRVRMPLLAS
jgi:hypothetical protein